MQLINRDFYITGKHAEIINKLKAIGLYTDNISIWIEGALIGMYFGEKSEPDSSKKHEARMSGRLYFQNRSDEEIILLTFLQHEKKFLNHPLSTSDIFLINPDTHEINDMINELSQYAFYGIEYLGREFEEIINETNTEIIMNYLVGGEYYSSESISSIVAEESASFYKDEIESSLASVLRRRE